MVEDKTSTQQPTRRGVRVRGSTEPVFRGRRNSRSIDLVNRLYDTPLLRGKIHMFLFITIPVWAVYLLKQCSTGWAKLSAWVCIVSCAFNSGCSLMLHNIHWISVPARTFWRQLDHVGIFAMIVGSAAPVPLLAFSDLWKWIWISTQLAVVATGILLCYFFGDWFSNQHSCGSRAVVYVVVGLLNLAFLAEFHRALAGVERWLLAGLASCYCLGAAMYGVKRPNPIPSVLGYHECFHIMCFLSLVLTVTLNVLVIRRHKINAGKLCGALDTGAGLSFLNSLSGP